METTLSVLVLLLFRNLIATSIELIFKVEFLTFTEYKSEIIYQVQIMIGYTGLFIKTLELTILNG